LLSSLLMIIVVLPALAKTGETTKGTVVSLEDPLGIKEGGPAELYGRIIRAFLQVIGMVTLLIAIIGGYWLLTSAGNPERVKKGKDTFFWGAVGLVGTLASYVIVRYIIQALVGT
ncbi:MAG TPA: hypothetical protein VGA49_01080, partial [Patescibacteria group bacterium]